MYMRHRGRGNDRPVSEGQANFKGVKVGEGTKREVNSEGLHKKYEGPLSTCVQSRFLEKASRRDTSIVVPSPLQRELILRSWILVIRYITIAT